mmetsp:Transcript_5176/g.14755  ORF Transcript_5176/g.14755 Transcript_5176/m.14755 type:complete len:115 (-) Transcript_5176:795-1139(-)
MSPPKVRECEAIRRRELLRILHELDASMQPACLGAVRVRVFHHVAQVFMENEPPIHANEKQHSFIRSHLRHHILAALDPHDSQLHRKISTVALRHQLLTISRVENYLQQRVRVA